LVAVLLTVSAVRADIRGCVCDISDARSAAQRTCNLCAEVAKHSADGPVLFVKDVNPTKPNRWLALPKARTGETRFDGANPLPRMSQAERDAFWSAAIAKARELWGDNWGIAMNGDQARTQCHLHAHIGKLLDEGRDEDDTESGIFVDSVSQIPAPADGTGLWFHPLHNRLHVHTGGQTTEHILAR
jgi:CDP-diacylglycerol pyrophosphatase